jgi:pentose-5-phosphate-3-epimerase
MHHILIGTDSRGAYFKDFLSQHNLFSNDWEIHIDVAPGGTIKTISEKLLIKVKTLPVAINTQIVIMIAGGICNLTVKKKASTLVDIF